MRQQKLSRQYFIVVVYEKQMFLKKMLNQQRVFYRARTNSEQCFDEVFNKAADQVPISDQTEINHCDFCKCGSGSGIGGFHNLQKLFFNLKKRVTAGLT